jgi:hypothetical protein
LLGDGHICYDTKDDKNLINRRRAGKDLERAINTKYTCEVK